MRKHSIIRFLFLGVLIIIISNPAMARRNKTKKHRKQNGQLVTSLNDAMNRSNADQQKIKVKVDFETQERMDSWDDRSTGVIEIKHTGTTSSEPVDLGAADYSMEPEGEDHSGLDGLHAPVEDESTDIDFDEELREVSSINN